MRQSNELLEMTKTLSQKNFMNFVRNEILTGYRYTCELHICHVCKRCETHLDLSYLPCPKCISVFCVLLVLHY